MKRKLSQLKPGDKVLLFENCSFSRIIKIAHITSDEGWFITSDGKVFDCNGEKLVTDPEAPWESASIVCPDSKEMEEYYLDLIDTIESGRRIRERLHELSLEELKHLNQSLEEWRKKHAPK